jgi:phage shock protein A
MASTEPTPLEKMGSEITQLQHDITGLQGHAQLSNQRDRIADLGTKMNSLPQQVADLRTRGYVFDKALETRVKTMGDHWRSLLPALQMQLNQQAAQLRSGMPAIESLNTRVNGLRNNLPAGRPLVDQLRAQVDTLEGKVSAAETLIGGMYDSVERDYGQLTFFLGRIDWMLDQLSAATFKLLATESGVMAVKAVWCPNGKEDKDDPDGWLLLTDQRLFFEQKEEVATRKVLFITTAKQLVQKLLLEVPLSLVEDVKPSKLGVFKNEDHIDLRLASGAPYPTAHFHLDGQSCEEWQALINRVRAGELDQDRAVALDQEAVEKVKAAPTTCTSCGANINVPVLRGQDSITCPYCGKVMKL